MTAQRFIETAPGVKVDYESAIPSIRAAADSGQYKIVDAIEPVVKVAKFRMDTPIRDPGLLAKAKEEALTTEESQRKVREEADLYAANMRQARIDAINQSFRPRIQRETEEGAARLERVKALNFRKGNVGSGFDTTKIDEQGKLNEDALRAIEDEKAILINEAFGYADQLGKERAEQLTKERQGIAEDNVKKYQDRYDRAVKSLQSFGAAEVTLEDLKKADPDTYSTLRDVGGLSDFEMTSIINQSNPKVKAELKFENGVVYQYYTDPKSGKVVITTQVASDVPKDYKPQFAPDGTLLFFPEKIDPNKPISEQVITGGRYNKPSTPTGSSSEFKFNQGQNTKLIGMGFDPETVNSLETFLRTNSLEEALGLMKSGDQPLTDTQKNQIRSIFED